MSQAWSAHTPPAPPPLRPVTHAHAAAHASASASDEHGDAGVEVTESFSVEPAAEQEGPGNGVQDDALQAHDGRFEREVIGECEVYDAPSLAVGSEDADTARQTCTPSDLASRQTCIPSDVAVDSAEASSVAPGAAATTLTRDESGAGRGDNGGHTSDFNNMQRPSEVMHAAAHIHTVIAPLVGLYAPAAAAVNNDDPPPAISPFLNLRRREVRCEVMLCRWL